MTFPSSGNCNGVNRTYSAYGDQQLSQLFDCETTSHNNSNSPLQLHLSEGGTVVTLLATWLDSIIVIRKMERFLAVTIKVTGHIAFESEGLCNAGCPNHQYVGKIWGGVSPSPSRDYMFPCRAINSIGSP